ncbi:MAG: quinone-dependent dihydroorotate dehydrogenase [Gammaproteobacteria bacterium]|nr:quinone-dependent dihydroorotate dehydrogenase [Gammaproteobacteria bacterium]
MYRLLRQALFLLPPEWAHALVLHTLNRMPACCFARPPAAPVQAMGLTFPNRVGLAAGLDKDGAFIQGLSKLPFGFIEVGTVTPLPQAGNAKPRLFRLPQEHALINRLGFNNQGVDRLVERLSLRRYPGILGINIGKNKDTPLNQAVQDYLICYEKVYPFADYVTLNISSPNTQDLRLLQQGTYFSDLLQAMQEAQHRLADIHQRWVPLVVKCSPDETLETLKTLAQQVLQYGISGMIATNTTVSRPCLKSKGVMNESGGLSGRPLFERSTQTLRLLKAEVGHDVTLIAAGGIENEKTAMEKLAAGADLLQLYTGLIYEGPGLVHRLVGLSVPVMR